MKIAVDEPDQPRPLTGSPATNTLPSGGAGDLSLVPQRRAAGGKGSRYASSNSASRLLTGHAPSLVLAMTVWVRRVAGSCTERNETPAS